MVSAVAEAVAAPEHVKGGIRNVQSEQSILDVAKIEEGVQDMELNTKAPGRFRLFRRGFLLVGLVGLQNMSG